MFNSLKHFNVCQPGVLSCDLALYLKYFIMEEKWFTYSVLNRHIKQFRYSGSDSLTKPCEVNPQSTTLLGQAIQDWNFLRPLLVIIVDRVQDTEDAVWQLSLQLSQVSYLDVIIQEYLESRDLLFPGHKLRPKHQT